MNSRIIQFDEAEFAALISAQQTFVLTTHVNPDGDALGSEIGLAEWLLSIGKNVRVINHSPIPHNYLFLDSERPIIEQFDAARHSSVIRSADVLMLLDTNDPSRAKSLEPFFADHKLPVLIDHHLEPKEFATHRFIDTEATSTGEMIFRLVKASIEKIGGQISSKAAQGLYVAIMTDTGSFKFPRTTATTFRIAAELIDLGADPVVTYNQTYNTARPSRIKLIGTSLASLELFFDDRLAIQHIMQDDLRAAGATDEEVDGFVQFPLQVGTIEFSIFALELKEGWKISFRSRGVRSAAEVAKQFNGNGHFHAAGARIYSKDTFIELRDKICTAVKIEIDKKES